MARNQDGKRIYTDEDLERIAYEKAHGKGSWRRRNSSWSEPMGGGDSAGNPITVSFGEGSREGETFLADGDASESNFLEHEGHDHYGSGNGPNNNGTRRGRYTGPGH